MKKAPLLLLLLAFMCTPAAAHAQETASTTALEASTTVVTAEETVAVTETALPTQGVTEKVKVRIFNLIANISNALDARTLRLGDIVSRLDTRITKMEADGYMVTQARDQLTLAKAYREEVATDMATVDAQVSAALLGEKPQDGWRMLAGELKASFLKLRATKDILKQTIVLLKDAEKMPDTKAQTSTSTTSGT